MIMAMVDVDQLKKSILCVVIETNNLVRMEKADPVTLESIKEGGLLPAPKYPENLSLLIAYEPDIDELYKRAREGGPKLLAWLERGRKFIPGVDGKVEAFRVPKIGSQESNDGR